MVKEKDEYIFKIDRVPRDLPPDEYLAKYVMKHLTLSSEEKEIINNIMGLSKEEKPKGHMLLARNRKLRESIRQELLGKNPLCKIAKKYKISPGAISNYFRAIQDTEILKTRFKAKKKA